MVRNTLNWAEAGVDFDDILAKLQQQIDGTSAFIMVDDLNHLVKGGRLSNGSALIGNLLVSSQFFILMTKVLLKFSKK